MKASAECHKKVNVNVGVFFYVQAELHSLTVSSTRVMPVKSIPMAVN